MKHKKLRKFCIVLLALVFLGSGTMVLLQTYQQRLADKAYEDAAKIALSEPTVEVPAVTTPEPSTQLTFPELLEPQLPLADTPEEEVQEPLPEQAELLLDLDLEALREVNEDVLGWIHIPDTAISYPLMRSQDNSEYLKLTWDLTYSSAGSIFLERKNSADLSDFHTLIYGHNMKNGTMFSNLRHYRDQEYLDNHPCVYIATDDAILRYEVFSAYTADVSTDTYRLYFEDDGRKQSVIDFYLEQSEVESDLVPTVEDRILTLSTCTGMGDYDYRLVVQAVLTGQFSR